jgi:phage head maturation protease
MRPNRDRLAFPARADLVTRSSFTFAAGPDTTSGRPVRVSGLAVPWNVVVQLNFWGDTVEFAPGSVDPPTAGYVPFLLDHSDHAMGYGESFTATADGLDATMVVPADELDDPDTARAMRQMANGVRTALSIGALIETADRSDGDDGADHYTVTAARLLELSSVLVPRFDDARVSSIAATALHTRGGFMSTTGLPTFPRTATAPVRLDQPDPPDDDDTGDHDDDDQTEPTESSALPARTFAQDRRRGPAPVPYQTRRPARDTSLAGISRVLASTGGDPRLVRAALADVTTTDVPGLVRPQYVDELLGLLGQGTPAIDAFRQGNLTSNPVVFPTWTTLPLVDKVTGEKVAIPSGDAVIGSTTIAVDTYAGGNDVSVQTIDWASPDFLTAYFQACTEIYGRKIEQAFETGLVAWATDLGLVTPTSIVDVIGAVIAAVAGKGLPGSLVLLVSGDVLGSMFVELANSGSAGLFATVNASFPTPRFVVAPFLPAGTIVGGMSGCAISFQNSGAPIRLRAVDVGLLGVDVGVYGYFAAAALYPAGLVKATGFTAAAAFATDLSTPGGDLLHGSPPAAAPAKSSTATKSASSS